MSTISAANPENGMGATYLPAPGDSLGAKIEAKLKGLGIQWALGGSRALGIDTVKCRLRCGHSMILDTNDLLGHRLLQERTFEPAVRNEFVRHAAAGGTILDIGANIGYYTMLGASLISRDSQILAFEPQPRVVAKLRRNIEFNRLRNVSVFPCVLSDSDGVCTFFVPKAGNEGHGSLQENGRFEVREKVAVQSRRLDDVLTEMGDPEIGLIKMDVEGAELKVLRGAGKLLQRHRKPVLIFEANEDNCKPFGTCVFDLLRYIHGFGYRLRQIDREDWIAEPESRC